MPQFDVSYFSSQLFWLVLVFGFLYIIVSKFIAPKAENIITYRNRYFEDNISISEHCNHEARALRQLKEVKLEELNADAEAIRKNAIEALETYFLEQTKDLSLSLGKKTEESLDEIQKYVNSFYLGEAKSTTDLASFIIEKITGKPADLNLLIKIHEAK